MPAVSFRFLWVILCLPVFLYASPWETLLIRIQSEKSVEAHFSQIFMEKQSGMEIEDRGILVAVYGQGLVVEYEDGRTYILDREGIRSQEGGGDVVFHPWDESLQDNPLLWLVGLAPDVPEPEQLGPDRTLFGSRPGMWNHVVMEWTKGMSNFPRTLSVTDEDDSTNTFTFTKIHWGVRKTHPLVIKLTK
ncbi:MAG TPA: hypothetical protein PK014_11345 [Thermoanaerobaculia bacterium]|nr:hypothetical protein [Thermoanaerobaculia bacterium]HUM30749.1 hypothetical protein [Thermoanaerobaculia bacterium]HXK68962.1 hypothetical protein [Thermoanaerobaculia bacterium]